MRILWLNWKDIRHPAAGGAEVVNHALMQRLVADGHEVTLVTARPKGLQEQEVIDGVSIVRKGNRVTVYLRAWREYMQQFRGKVDLVVDEVNTVPFFASLFARERTILFIHQLAREIWWYEMFFPLNMIGYLVEPLYLWLLRREQVITVSESSKRDLLRFGFQEKNIHILSEGIECTPVASLLGIEKYPHPTILALGAVRSMKRTHHILKAFEVLKCDNFQFPISNFQNLHLIIAGDISGRYGRKILRLVARSRFKSDIAVLGRVSPEEKINVLQRSHVLAAASVKEGWGLVVTEANSQGTPAVVYGVDGLRDSVRNGETGIVCAENTPRCMAREIASLLNDRERYERLRLRAWEWSKEITFDRAYRDLSLVFWEHMPQ